jgi:integrase
MANAKHTVMGGKVHVYQRENSTHWQCATYLAGRNWRVSTKEESLAKAKDYAEDWYLGLVGKQRNGELRKEKSFREAADQFTREYEIITAGQRSPLWVEGHKARLRLHLLPFFADMGLSEINGGKAQEYRIHRIQTAATGKPPSRKTIHNEIVTLRQVLKTAMRHGWLQHLPDLSPPYNKQSKISHRAWFSDKEYKQLYEATRRRAAKPWHERHRWNAEQVHDFVLFMANTGLRPDEAKNLQHRDVEIVEDEATGETILEIEVRGKRGVGYCKSTQNAVRPYQRLVARNKPAPTDVVFPGNHIKLFNNVLREEGLKSDRDGQPRTAYSLRHTYICLRLMEGADIYQIAKNCRTSVEMIEKYYASHIKTSLDAAAINIRRKKRRKKTEKDALDSLTDL